MPRLSLSIDQLKPHYDVVVIGSGYGGGIAASRMARAGRRVALLERGREFQPGEYPDRELEAATEMQLNLPDRRIGRETALFDFRVNPDINVLVGCGLGGTSLINANVSLEPQQWVLDDAVWPQALLADRDRLADGFARARAMLRPVPLPAELSPCKLAQLEKGADGAPFYRPPLNVNFTAGVNPVGVYQDACTGCGDCVSGCNTGAKNTTLMNYLPDARHHGAEIFTETAVRWLERSGNGWRVFFDFMGGAAAFGGAEMHVSANVVVLAAGTLGSTEILLRSREKGLAVSDQLGEHFTGNGDFLAFGYNTDDRCNAIGTGTQVVELANSVGPCITGIIDARGDTNTPTPNGMVIEEGVIPGALSAMVPAGLAAAAAAVGQDTDGGLLDKLREVGRSLERFNPIRAAYHGASNHTMTYLVMTHDDAKGRVSLAGKGVHISWPGAGSQPIFRQVSDRLQAVTGALGGTYVRNPAWSPHFKNNLTTVHPLGGCVMADNATRGVVNHKGQVFSGATGEAVYDSLYVCDGAIVPRTLGVNPLLTISALAERACYYMAADRGWPLSYDVPLAPNVVAPAAGNVVNGPHTGPPVAAEPVGIRFTERMTGFLSTTTLAAQGEPSVADYEAAFEQGKRDNAPFSFVLTVTAPDVERLIRDPTHPAGMAGTVEAPALSPEPLTATDGHFNLFVADPLDATRRYMRYQMRLTDVAGRPYFFEGHKIIHDDTGFDVWQDTTTLFITLYDGPTIAAPVLGRGQLHIRPDDFRRQMTTVKVLNARTWAERLATQLRFGQFFAQNLVDVYV